MCVEHGNIIPMNNSLQHQLYSNQSVRSIHVTFRFDLSMVKLH